MSLVLFFTPPIRSLQLTVSAFTVNQLVRLIPLLMVVVFMEIDLGFVTLMHCVFYFIFLETKALFAISLTLARV